MSLTLAGRFFTTRVTWEAQVSRAQVKSFSEFAGIRKLGHTGVGRYKMDISDCKWSKWTQPLRIAEELRFGNWHVLSEKISK